MNNGEQTKARALGVNHVVLEVDDLDQALAFYGSLFEFTLRGHRYQVAGGVIFVTVGTSVQ